MTTMEGDRKMGKIWTVEALLTAWGEQYEYGRIPPATFLSSDGDGVTQGIDEGHLARLYVEGLNPASLVLARAFVVARPALVHIYAKVRPPEQFEVPLLPGQTCAARAITCNQMVATYRDVLEIRVKEHPFSPSGFQAEAWRG